MTHCLERRVLERFLAGTASRAECQTIVRHLLARCSRCAIRLRSIFRPTIEEAPEEVAPRAMKSIGSL